MAGATGSLSDMFYRDYQKFRMWGPKNIIFAAVKLFFYLYFIEHFGKFIWPTVLHYMRSLQVEEWQFSVFFSWIYNACIFFGSNLFFMVLYKLKHPLIEQYKV